MTVGNQKRAQDVSLLMRTRSLLTVLVLTAGACAADDTGAVSSQGTSTTAPSDGATTSSTQLADSEDGATAVWSTDADDPPTPTSQSFTAMVSRLGCSGGKTGKVLPPSVSVEKTRIVVTFAVEPLPDGFYHCPGNDSVPHVVELDEPIGDRDLVDGACLSREAETTSFCSEGGATRWTR